MYFISFYVMLFDLKSTQKMFAKNFIKGANLTKPLLYTFFELIFTFVLHFPNLEEIVRLYIIVEVEMEGHSIEFTRNVLCQYCYFYTALQFDKEDNKTSITVSRKNNLFHLN